MTKKYIFNYLASTVLAFASCAECHALDGAWRGELSVNSAKLPLVFNFSNDESGHALCTLDSPLQGVKDLATDVAFCDADSVSIQIKSIGASFTGKITGNVIAGTFAQSGLSFPLTLTPEQSVYDRRPQTPRAPYPYITTDTTFASADGTMLAATLTMPAWPRANVPAVVLVSGSGPQNRDEEIFEHRPFAVIADYLARNGIASLRYDDRGVAKSHGDYKTADIDTFKSDAGAAVKFLRKVYGVGKTGVIGHSEGGTIALMLAADGDVDYAISMAGAIVKGKDLILAQNLRSLNSIGMPQKQKDDAMLLISKVFDDIINGKDCADINIDEYVKADGLDIPAEIKESISKSIAMSAGTYFRKLLSLNPKEWLHKIKAPVMAINGTLDTQVLSGENLAALSKALPEAIVKEYQGLNHMFQHAKTGDITEYSQIAETISPEVLTDIAQFIKAQK